MSEELNSILNTTNDHSKNQSEVKKYPALRFLIIALQVYSMVNLLAGIIFSIFTTVYIPNNIGTLLMILIMLLTAFSTIFLWAISESINVFIDIEENTRKNFLISQRLISKLNAIK